MHIIAVVQKDSGMQFYINTQYPRSTFNFISVQ